MYDIKESQGTSFGFWAFGMIPVYVVVLAIIFG